MIYPHPYSQKFVLSLICRKNPKKWELWKSKYIYSFVRNNSGYVHKQWLYMYKANKKHTQTFKAKRIHIYIEVQNYMYNKLSDHTLFKRGTIDGPQSLIPVS